MNIDSKNEIIGRLWLWANSVSKTEELLNLSFKAKELSNNQNSIIDSKNTFTPHDYFATQDACIELAIVSFTQIFNQGYGEEGKIAVNKEKLVRDHFTNIISKVFDSKEDLEKFQELKGKTVRARNTMIGHSDASSYSISHGQISMLTSSHSWRDIDLIFWHSFLEKMHTEIHNYSNRIKLDRG